MTKLNDIPGKNPFKIPENYFEKVTRKIISETAGSGSEPGKSGLLKRLRPYYAIAASIAALVIISLTAIKIFIPEKRNVRLPEITLEEFTESYFGDIDIITLEMQAESFDPPAESSVLFNSEITEYLLLENIDINEIYELF